MSSLTDVGRIRFNLRVAVVLGVLTVLVVFVLCVVCSLIDVSPGRFGQL